MRLSLFSSSFRYLTLGLLCLALAASSASAAGVCGDDVEGRDIPCGCGDTLVSSLVLGDDPVTREICRGDALALYAPHARERLRIDLNGATLRGSYRGTGVRIVNAGSGGVEIVSGGGIARILNFRDGIVAIPPGAVHRLEAVAIEQCARDGLRIRARGTIIELVEVRDAGRDGFALHGDDWEMRDVRAFGSGRFGFYATGARGRLGTSRAGAVAERSGAAGFQLMGGGHALIDCAAVANRRDGVHLNGSSFDVDGCTVHSNGGKGIAGVATASRFGRNYVSRNGKANFAVMGDHEPHNFPPPGSQQ